MPVALGYLTYGPGNQIASTTDTAREAQQMNYPLLPADAAAYAWQLSCCLVTLLFAMFSWMIGPR